MEDFQNEPQMIEDDQVSAPAPEQEATEDENSEAPQEQKVTFDEAQQAVMNKAIGSKVAKTHEANRRADALQKELDEARTMIPVETAPQVPDMPNPDDFWDDPQGLTKAQNDRDAAFINRAEYDATQKAATVAEQQNTFKQQQVQQQELNRAVESYVTIGKEFGLEPDKINKEADMVAQSLDPQVRSHLLNDSQGPLIVNFLANNMAALDEMTGLSPMQTASYIDQNIRPKLASTRRTTNAPAPNSVVDGTGAPDKTPQSIKGATFD